MDVWVDNVFDDADGSPALTFRARSKETFGSNLEVFVEETEEDFAGEVEKGKSASSNESRGSSRGSASSLGSKQNGAAQIGMPADLSVVKFTQKYLYFYTCTRVQQTWC